MLRTRRPWAVLTQHIGERVAAPIGGFAAARGAKAKRVVDSRASRVNELDVEDADAGVTHLQSARLRFRAGQRQLVQFVDVSRAVGGGVGGGVEDARAELVEHPVHARLAHGFAPHIDVLDLHDLGRIELFGGCGDDPRQIGRDVDAVERPDCPAVRPAQGRAVGVVSTVVGVAVDLDRTFSEDAELRVHESPATQFGEGFIVLPLGVVDRQLHDVSEERDERHPATPERPSAPHAPRLLSAQ